MGKKERRRVTLNIRLLRKGFTASQAFGPTFAPGSVRALAESDWPYADGAKLYTGQIYANPPEWLDFIGMSRDGSGLTTAGAGAVIFIPVDTRLFAISFGQVHIALSDDAFERQFGLRVALNAVPADQLRTLDLATPDAVTFQKRVQASKDSDLSEFGVDMLRDLARVAGGTPDEPTFATFVAGKDSLSLTCAIAPKEIRSKCLDVLRMYLAKTYQNKFSWVDNLRVVEERSTISALDEKIEGALKDLMAGNRSELHLAPPEIVDYLDGTDLHYNGVAAGVGHKTFTSLSIDDYVDELKQAGIKPDCKAIREKHRVVARNDTSGTFKTRWHIYDCFVFETTLGRGPNLTSYTIFNGEWYQVEKHFKTSVETFFNKVPKVSVIGATKCKNERELIAKLEGSRRDLVKLDQQKVNPADVRYGNLEPCDFFSDKRDFIHLKDGHSSGPISHLWSQGVVSADAFVRDQKFRSDVRAIVKGLAPGHAALLPLAGSKVIRDDFRVVYGIMRSRGRKGSLDIPFFSKVSFQAAAEKITQLGIPVAIEIIEKL